MPVRLFLILTLLMQPLALPGVVSRDRAAACVADACCTVVETVTCCGDRVVEVACGRTGDDCRCGAAPAEPVTPPAPRPREAKDLGSIVAMVAAPVTLAPPPAPRPLRWTAPPIGRTHNETQALLCIWRT